MKARNALSLGWVGLLLLSAIPLLSAVPGPTWAATTQCIIKDGADRDIFSATNPKAGLWTGEAGGQKFGLEIGEVYTFTLPDGTSLKATRKDDKLKLKKAETLVVEVKFSSDKIKVMPGGAEAETIEIKFKGDKIKVDRGQSELGQIKYYPDKGKLKAKDSGGAEVAVTKDLGKLSPVLAPFLAGQLTGEVKAFLVLYFLATNK